MTVRALSRHDRSGALAIRRQIIVLDADEAKEIFVVIDISRPDTAKTVAVSDVTCDHLTRNLRRRRGEPVHVFFSIRGRVKLSHRGYRALAAVQ